MELKDILELMTEDSRVEIEYYPTPALKATVQLDFDDKNAVSEAIGRFGDAEVLSIDNACMMTIRI